MNEESPGPSRIRALFIVGHGQGVGRRRVSVEDDAALDPAAPILPYPSILLASIRARTPIFGPTFHGYRDVALPAIHVGPTLGAGSTVQ